MNRIFQVLLTLAIVASPALASRDSNRIASDIPRASVWVVVALAVCAYLAVFVVTATETYFLGYGWDQGFFVHATLLFLVYNIYHVAWRNGIFSGGLGPFIGIAAAYFLGYMTGIWFYKRKRAKSAMEPA